MNLFDNDHGDLMIDFQLLHALAEAGRYEEAVADVPAVIAATLLVAAICCAEYRTCLAICRSKPRRHPFALFDLGAGGGTLFFL